MMKAFILAILLALQGPLVTVSMNKGGTTFAVAFPKDTVVQSCIKFESQTERIVLDGVDQKYTPTSCVIFADSLRVENGPNGEPVGIETGTPRTGYAEEFPLNEFSQGEWHIWAEAQVVGADTLVKSNVLTWTNTNPSAPSPLTP